MKHTLTEIVKGTRIKFHSFKDGIFNYTVKLEDGTIYLFEINISDIDNATLLPEDKAMIFMRWIRKSIEKGTLIESTEADDSKEFTFFHFRENEFYYRGNHDGKTLLFPIKLNDVNKMISLTENFDSLQQWIQQAQDQQSLVQL